MLTLIPILYGLSNKVIEVLENLKMSDTIAITKVNSAVAPSNGVEKKIATKKTTKQNKTLTTPTHPPTQHMVDASITNLKERGGSSLLAIKKYITATYKCDAQKLAPFIKKYLKSAVANGKIIQTKGKGASGSFKLSASSIKSKSIGEKGKSKSKVAKETDKGKGIVKKKVASGAKKVNAEKGVKKAVAVATKKTEKKASDKIKARDSKKAGPLKAKPTKSKPSGIKSKASNAKVAVVKSRKARPTATKKPVAKKVTPKK